MILTRWQQCFPGCEPLAHQLKFTFPDRWLRFYSLPDSKRYPENEEEYVGLLQRFNSVLGELADDGETIVLLTTGYSGTTEPIRSDPELLELDPDARPWRSVAMHLIETSFSDPTYWHVFASDRRWRLGLFDSLVRKVADDILVNVMLVAPDCSWLLHPYDGGMDVILESSAARDKLRTRFPQWLSPRADGY